MANGKRFVYFQNWLLDSFRSSRNSLYLVRYNSADTLKIAEWHKLFPVPNTELQIQIHTFHTTSINMSNKFLPHFSNWELRDIWEYKLTIHVHVYCMILFPMESYYERKLNYSTLFWRQTLTSVCFVAVWNCATPRGGLPTVAFHRSKRVKQVPPCSANFPFVPTKGRCSNWCSY